MNPDSNASPATPAELVAHDVVSDKDGTTRDFEMELHTLHAGLKGLATTMRTLSEAPGRCDGYVLGVNKELFFAMVDTHAGMAGRVADMWEGMQRNAIAARGVQA